MIAWVKTLFTVYRKEMKSVEWGELYNKYNKNDYDAAELEEEISKLITDDEVTNHKEFITIFLTGKNRT